MFVLLLCAESYCQTKHIIFHLALWKLLWSKGSNSNSVNLSSISVREATLWYVCKIDMIALKLIEF